MHVIFISTVVGHTWGGGEELWFSVAQTMLDRDAHISVVGFEDIGASTEIQSLKRRGVDVRLFHVQNYVKRSFFKRLSNKLSGSGFTKNNRYIWIDETDADLILVNLSTVYSLIVHPDLNEWLRTTPKRFCLLVQHHGEAGRIPNLESGIIKDVFRKSFLNFFVALRNLKVLERQLACTITNQKIVSNPIKISLTGPVEYPGGETIRLATVARLDCNTKGHDIVLEVLSNQKWKERNFRLTLYGSGPDETYLKALIEFYLLSNRVLLAGYEGDVKKIWRENHLLLLGSHSEGTPLSILEAMACGRACIVTDVGDNARFVKHGHSGFVAKGTSVSALDEALELAWKNQGNWEEMGRNAYLQTIEGMKQNPTEEISDWISRLIYNQNTSV